MFPYWKSIVHVCTDTAVAVLFRVNTSELHFLHLQLWCKNLIRICSCLVNFSVCFATLEGGGWSTHPRSDFQHCGIHSDNLFSFLTAQRWSQDTWRNGTGAVTFQLHILVRVGLVLYTAKTHTLTELSLESGRMTCSSGIFCDITIGRQTGLLSKWHQHSVEMWLIKGKSQNCLHQALSLKMMQNWLRSRCFEDINKSEIISVALRLQYFHLPAT